MFFDPGIYSTLSGRGILEWYWKLEAWCAAILFRPLILPPYWVDEARRIRNERLESEYPHLSPELRFPRLLDDMWQETWSALPAYIEAIVTVMSLKNLRGQQLIDAAALLERDISLAWETLDRVKESPRSAQLFETMEVGLDTYSLRHSKCCPSPPFHALVRYLYPLAATLDLMIMAMRASLRTYMYVPARQAGCYIETLEQELQRIDTLAYEMCRTFAAIEEAVPDFPGSLMPFFTPFLTVGFCCKVELRSWFWHKLAHFEELGSTFIEPNKRQLAIFWGMPELLVKGFTSMKIEPLENREENDQFKSADLDEAGKVAEEEPPGRLQMVDEEELDLDESP